ncbi:uncharacterized protein N7459_006246 [Penicillium hispanicum]|uniref:uncharacterized protein n=1 Tax=Penicillium hispanicum TaxID=1080232 RepID=UPI00254198EF|nr:uncharacterized protein N7459_006246 [Penicillium hispanicum]KAJ5580261.1 hypothetical protein N7459_006246 [Penicillium hispanicum]
MSSPCAYDCSAPSPPLLPDNDITGIGVVINYVATAGIVLLVILVYYLAIYQPAQDPFERHNPRSSGGRFRPNPVDALVLGWLLRSPTTSSIPRRTSPTRIRLERIFIKCLIAMSDLQTVAGLSILISGLVQFRCGLAAYYWLVVPPRPARGKRTWRMAAMLALAVLLIVGIAFTANYWWMRSGFYAEYPNGIAVPFEGTVDTGLPGRNGHAICFLGTRPTIATLSARPMILSIIFIVIAFVSRVIKLHRTLSLRRGLRRVYIWSGRSGSTRSLKRKLGYHPLLAIFLTARLVLDGWWSVFLELAWLVVAFAWGVLRLHDTVTAFASGPGDWSFGQVVAMFMLVAPVLTIVGYFEDEAGDKETCTEDDVGDSLAVPGESPEDPEHPDGDWKRQPATLGAAVFYCFTVWVVWSGLVLAGSVLEPVDWIFRFYYDLLLTVTGLFEVILFSLLIEAVCSHRGRWRFGLHLLSIGVFVLSCSAITAYYVSVLFLQAGGVAISARASPPNAHPGGSIQGSPWERPLQYCADVCSSVRTVDQAGMDHGWYPETRISQKYVRISPSAESGPFSDPNPPDRPRSAVRRLSLASDLLTAE